MTLVEQSASNTTNIISKVGSAAPVKQNSEDSNAFSNTLIQKVNSYGGDGTTKLSIVTNDDGSAQINFPGGGYHRVTGGPLGPVKALEDAYGDRLNSQLTASKAPSSSKLSRDPTTNFTVSSQQDGQDSINRKNPNSVLKIVTNDDGSAQINFPGGGYHRVTGGPLGPVKALEDAYKYRLNSESAENIEGTIENSKIIQSQNYKGVSSDNFPARIELEVAPTGYSKEKEITNPNKNLSVVSKQDGTAQINFLGGGWHHVSGGIFGPIQAFKDAYGPRIASISYPVSEDYSEPTVSEKAASKLDTYEVDLTVTEFLPSLKILVDRNISTVTDKIADQAKV